ncbi:mitochondrial ribosomal protein S29 precursor, putative [Plasmodium berghei]|uniref:Small ribosomal subunit protein mS29 n=2 Tax=Plasmodium berghei TaxID=5821 RepID=A0A509ARY2_PLABA|nr:mitochondrial ribosomal protein S29 precursor, putative [Plasmodium berghei ANKA]CXI89724.1 mitochondrial ribosomal protein S29 precursor, putative [Plasmodium berghei]SCL96117.1 mitochondrial ribosomal protein S29 precursor, putative [Plasmodium berghei]SCM16367.1 mitochondrial ribosomal protein S29 precursor, putative [Plasmodium berghei]SCM18161.1 mitochondrial ribosomal protein S29 precursor, putative [Plasmodium berghei]SCN27588.1 mitochondrial ribosomal protein S29 precursor, putative|eukprot:XP_034423244.1 mitochondrial ribosomal protein S29 precursor, putative [Plasmodium berghei ANKA]
MATLFTRRFNKYNIPRVINNTKVHKIYRETNKRHENDLFKIYNKELVAFPYEEDKYNELLNIKVNKENRNIADFYFNPNIYINVHNNKIKNLEFSDFDLENVDKYFLFEKEYLDTYFPEGLAGEIPKDILMHNTDNDNFDIFLNKTNKQNSKTNNESINTSNSLILQNHNFEHLKGVGILYRKLTHEIINELQICEKKCKTSNKRESYNLDKYFLSNKKVDAYYDNAKNIINATCINTDEEKTQTSDELKNNIYKSRSILIDGKRGTGKSCILNTVVLWAKLRSWIVIFIPDIKKYKFDINTIVRSNTNLYIQPELSKEFLENILKVNEKYLKEIKIFKDILYNTCLDGTHLLYNKKIYNDIIKKTIEEEISNDNNYSKLNDIEQNMYRQKLYKFYQDNIKIPNILDKFPIPQNLVELINIGINNSAYSNLCVYILFEHLKKQTQFPVLIAVDQFNYNLSVSEYLSINFENTKYNGYIPTYYFTIPKLLLQWNTSKYKRCVKIVSTCWDRENRRNFRPDFLGINKKEIKTLRNFTLVEFKNYVSHLFNQNVIYNFDINKLEYFYMLTGGNGFQARKLLTTLY